MTKKAHIVILLAAAMFCLCFVAAIKHEQSELLGAPYEIIVKPESTLKNSAATAAGQISGVMESGYYMSQTLTLTVGGYSINLSVFGIASDYTVDGYKVGSGITLNRAAIEEIEEEYSDNRSVFSDYYTPRYNLGSDELTFNLDAVIPNKTDDDSPSAYMNVNQMSLLMKKLGKDGSFNQLILKLSDYSQLSTVKDALSELDLVVASDTAAITKQAEEYDIHTLYLSIIICIALTAVLGSHKLDGATILFGYFLGTGAAVFLPYLFPPSERNALVFGLSAPVWFYFAAFAVVAAIVVLKELCNND